MNKYAIMAAICVAAAGLSCASAEDDSDKNVQPLEPPIVNYPANAIQRGIVGNCNATLDVSKSGTVANLKMACTHEYFCRESKSAVSGLKYAPKIVNGSPVERTGVVYPIEFSMADTNGELRSVPPNTPFEPCR